MRLFPLIMLATHQQVCQGFEFFTYQNDTLRVQRGGNCCCADVSGSNVPSNTQGTPGNYLLQVDLFRQCFCPIKPDKLNSAQSWFGQNDVHVQAALARSVKKTDLQEPPDALTLAVT